MTFKEQLTAKAEQTDIEEKIDYIKARMYKFYDKRTFKINLINAHTTMTIGYDFGNLVEYPIPEEFTPESYRQLFVDAFGQLGFSGEDITLESYSCVNYDSYSITLRW